MPDVEKKNEPCIFAGSLSDEELINFLENAALKLASRRRQAEMLESLREQAAETENNLRATNEFISSVVHRQDTSPSEKTNGDDTEGNLSELLFNLCSAELVIRTRIGEAENKVSRSAIMYFNKSTKEISSDLQDALIEQLDRAFAWHLSEWQ